MLSNRLQSAGRWTLANETVVLESGDFVRSIGELEGLLVNVIDGMPVYLRDIATIVDGPAEAENYSWIEFAPGHPRFSRDQESFPMVTISVAKHRGSNAVSVAHEVHERIASLQASILPPEIQVEVLRDHGQTANEKVNNLSMSLAFAIVTVVVFIGVFLGIREALVVGLAVPICYGITLALDLALGYTINRVTLFALILSLGLLVDDPITGVDNIERYMRRKGSGMYGRVVAAMAEIRTPLLMSTLTIVLAFVPLGFITGMMGPYMAPMAFNVPVSVAASTLVAFLVTPWLASRLLKPSTAGVAGADGQQAALLRVYSRFISPMLASRKRAWLLLLAVLGLFMFAASLPLFRMVPLKLLPYDNKNEIQVVIDMPEYSSLESTAARAKTVSNLVSQLPEVQAVAAFVGAPSPIDFNGMVRRYYQRNGPHMADLRLTLVDKDDREHQSHAVVLRLREILAPLNTGDARIKVVEVPPGPPVLSTLVVEIRGDELVSYEQQRAAATAVMARLAREPQVVEVDSTVEHEQKRLRFITDKRKAALSGVATEDINSTLALANHGQTSGFMQMPRETRPLPIELRLPVSDRSSLADFNRLRVKGRAGIVQQSTPQGLDTAAQPLVSIGELGYFGEQRADRAIHRKDLEPVVYVTAEISGRTPAEVIADIAADQDEPAGAAADRWQSRNFLAPGGGDGWSVPEGVEVLWTGEGEWRITVRVFRDMGLAFAFALIAIFFVLRLQTASTALSMIIMSSIPLTIIGIMPGFWLMNQFGERVIAGSPDPVMFTATAMIGMIALAGIVVRNSLILVEFITQARDEGLALKPALLQAGAVRMRPVLLTAGTTMLGNLIITLDPVFSGLALAIIFGIVASTLFTLLVVPVVYLLVFEQSEKGLSP
jgi:multidrug efflux pump subunit AcrB